MISSEGVNPYSAGIDFIRQNLTSTSQQYWILRVDGEGTILFLSKRRDRERFKG